MTLHFQVAEMASGSYWHLALLRWSMVTIFVWFGIQKFTPYAAEAIAPLIANSPFMSWLSAFGVRREAKIVGTIELTTATLLIIGAAIPLASGLGAAMACATFLLTTSFIFTTPGITQRSSTGFPIISTLLEQFLIKDVALFAASFTLLLASVSPSPATPDPAELMPARAAAGVATAMRDTSERSALIGGCKRPARPWRRDVSAGTTRHPDARPRPRRPILCRDIR